MSENELSSWGEFVSDENCEKISYKSYNPEIDSDEDEILYETVHIPIYDSSITFGDNFADGSTEKYMLFRITPYGFKSLPPNLVGPGTKIIADWENLASHQEGYDTIVVDYDTMFGLRLLTFQRYSSFFSCDERILFEALLIKFRAFNFIPFHWSFTVIFKELGIKKDRAATIFKRFNTLGFLSSEIKTTTIDKNPRQVTYYNILADKVLTLLPEIYLNYEEIESWIEKDITTYLEPALKKAVPRGEDKSPPDITQIMQ